MPAEVEPGPRRPPALIAVADAPLWLAPAQRHGFAFAVGRLASAWRAHPGAVGLWLRAHGRSAAAWHETLAELAWLAPLPLILGISAPRTPPHGEALATELEALRRAGVRWLQIAEADAAAWAEALATLRRPPAVAVARSCHDLAGVAAALAGSADWVTLSPLLATPSKPGVAGLGFAALDQATALHPGCVAALGGIDAAAATAVWRRGAAVAVLRAWQAEPAALAAAFDAARG